MVVSYPSVQLWASIAVVVFYLFCKWVCSRFESLFLQCAEFVHWIYTIWIWCGMLYGYGIPFKSLGSGKIVSCKNFVWAMIFFTGFLKYKVKMSSIYLNVFFSYYFHIVNVSLLSLMIDLMLTSWIKYWFLSKTATTTTKGSVK